ncbi:hypothetical protein E5D57_012435 [Metarhizium anisopliae]|nr:hypothetical protein E5D57_012435 [Metarhizium anisopliae]
MPAQGYHLRDSSRRSVPLRNLQNSLGTPSTTLKAAWALVLSAALSTSDGGHAVPSPEPAVHRQGLHRVAQLDAGKHLSVEASVPIGKAKGVFSIEAGAAHAADVMMAAIPRGRELQIQLYHDSDTIPANQRNWIRRTLETVMQAIPAGIQKTQGQIQDIVRQSTGTWPT